MHAFNVLSDPVRRSILELIAQGEQSSGAVVEVIQQQFGISQAGVSQHLKVLRESGFATVRIEGAKRIYSIETGPLQEVDAWLEKFRVFWAPKLDALGAEVQRGKRERFEMHRG